MPLHHLLIYSVKVPEGTPSLTPAVPLHAPAYPRLAADPQRAERLQRHQVVLHQRPAQRTPPQAVQTHARLAPDAPLVAALGFEHGFIPETNWTLHVQLRLNFFYTVKSLRRVRGRRGIRFSPGAMCVCICGERRGRRGV